MWSNVVSLTTKESKRCAAFALRLMDGRWWCHVRSVASPQRRLTLSADTVNLWSCVWLLEAAGSLGSAPGFLLQRKDGHVTSVRIPIWLCKWQTEREAEPSPFPLRLLLRGRMVCADRASLHWGGGVDQRAPLLTMATRRSFNVPTGFLKERLTRQRHYVSVMPENYLPDVCPEAFFSPVQFASKSLNKYKCLDKWEHVFMYWNVGKESLQMTEDPLLAFFRL